MICRRMWEKIFKSRTLYAFKGINLDGLVKSPIYVVVDLKRRFAVLHVLPNRRFRYYA